MPSTDVIELKMIEVSDFQPFFFAMLFLGLNSLLVPCCEYQETQNKKNFFINF